MRMYSEPARVISVTRDVDVIVVGGGPAGIASATGFGMAVGTGTSVKVAPERGTVYLTPWTNGIAVAQGQLFSYQQGAYMATTGMASSVTAPSADTNFRVLRSNKPREVLLPCSTSGGAAMAVPVPAAGPLAVDNAAPAAGGRSGH